MRTLLFLFFSLLIVGISDAQSDQNAKKGYYRTYHLPDGAILKGRIIGRLAKDSVIVETRDGLVYHLSNAEAKKGGKVFSPPSVPQTASVDEVEVVPNKPVLPLRKQPLFAQSSSQLAAELTTHFSSGGSVDGQDPESGIVATVSYLYGILPQVKVGGGLGIMTIKSGSKERVVPFFAKSEVQLRPKIVATLSAGYSIIPTNEFVINSKNGIYMNSGLAFDLVGPESAYTSRIGVGMVMQQIDLGRTEVIRENVGFGTERTYTQYVEREGWLRRFQITFTHAWRMPPASKSSKRKRK